MNCRPNQRNQGRYSKLGLSSYFETFDWFKPLGVQPTSSWFKPGRDNDTDFFVGDVLFLVEHGKAFVSSQYQYNFDEFHFLAYRNNLTSLFCIKWFSWCVKFHLGLGKQNVIYVDAMWIHKAKIVFPATQNSGYWAERGMRKAEIYNELDFYLEPSVSVGVWSILEGCQLLIEFIIPM